MALQAATGQWPGPSPGTNSPLDCSCPGSAYRIAFGPRAGQKLAPNAKLRAQVVPQEPDAPAQAPPPAECEANCAHHRPVRLSWARLLKRVFELDLEHCPNCGGELKIIAAILEQPVIEKILTHLGLQARAPPWAPVCGPPQLQAA